MRGLVGAAFVLAPALAAATVLPVSVPEAAEFDGIVDFHVADHSVALINVDVPAGSRSPDDWASQVLGFQIDVLSSKDACGFANVTIDGQVLPQTPEGDVMTGKGAIKTDRKSLVVATWTFHCVKVNGQPDSQFMKFNINTVDGKAVEDVGFSALFRQTGVTEILKIETDLSIPDKLAANPNPHGLLPLGEDVPKFNMDEEIAELHWMRLQLRELEYLISEKEQRIEEEASRHFDAEITDCDSLKCIAKSVADKARKAAHSLYGKISGDEFYHSEDNHRRPPKHHWPKPPPHGHHKNETWGPPGNHTHGDPHRHPLPICRYPPPPPHHGPGHHDRPSKRPHHGFEDDRPHQPPHPGHGFEDDRPHPPHHHEGPPPDFHHGPGEHDFPTPPPHHDGPPPDFHHGPGEHDFPPPPPPHHDQPGSQQPEFPDHEPEFDGPPPPHPPGPPHSGPPEGDRPPPPPHDDHRGPPPPPHDGHRGPLPPHGPHHKNFEHGPPRGIGKAMNVVKWTVIGFLVAFLLLVLQQRMCTPQRRADRQARREERHRRRAYRRAAKKHALARLIARLSGNAASDDEDYEEKEVFLSDAEDGRSTTMTEELTQLNNAASIVNDIAAEQMQVLPLAQPLPSAQPLPRSASLVVPMQSSTFGNEDFELASQMGLGYGEDLPAYEDNDGSDDSSIISDGFRYTPGSSNYSPAHSASGSVSDILGPDSKQ